MREHSAVPHAEGKELLFPFLLHLPQFPNLTRMGLLSGHWMKGNK